MSTGSLKKLFNCTNKKDGKMKTIYIIINGISLPYKVIDYVIEEAKKNSMGIYALFLKGSNEPSKGYLYPSDLRTIETGISDKEAIKEDEKIIADNVRLVRELVEDAEIPFTSILKTNASIDEVAALSDTADLIVVDENFDEMSLLSDNKISLKDLKKKISIPVYVVSTEKIS